jgi:hypothetical protein
MSATRRTPANQRQLQGHYGPGVSALLRSGDYPTKPSSYFVQVQMTTVESVSRWITPAVYRSRGAAERAVGKWRCSRLEETLVNTKSGLRVDGAELRHPAPAFRVVTLFDLFSEGAGAIANMMLDLATSDHEWILTSELGSAAKMALLEAATEPRDR